MVENKRVEKNLNSITYIFTTAPINDDFHSWNSHDNIELQANDVWSYMCRSSSKSKIKFAI